MEQGAGTCSCVCCAAIRDWDERKDKPARVIQKGPNTWCAHPDDMPVTVSASSWAKIVAQLHPTMKRLTFQPLAEAAE